MPVYAYKARDKRGHMIEGMVDAVSEETVAGLLSEKQLAIIEIVKRGAIGLERYNLNIFSRVKQKDLVFFFRQMSVMIDANLPIVKGLKILIKQTANKRLKAIIASVADEVDGGAKLSEAMGNFSDVFGSFYVSIIKSGETSGRLSEVMNYLADQEEKDYELQSKVRGAMIYPAFIVSVLVVVGFLVMTFVLPKITTILRESGVKLPIATRFLIGVSNGLLAWWWEIIILAVVLVVVFMGYIRTANGRRQFDLFKIKMPIFGKIFRSIYLVRICRSFATLLRGGVPMSSALEVVKEVTGNKIYQEILNQTAKEVAEGNSIFESFLLSPYIPVTVAQMVQVGEETGKLEEVLMKITDFYGREIDNSMRNLSTLIEPVIIVILGIGVAFFALAVILPIWQMSAAV